MVSVIIAENNDILQTVLKHAFETTTGFKMLKQTEIGWQIIERGQPDAISGPTLGESVEILIRNFVQAKSLEPYFKFANVWERGETAYKPKAPKLKIQSNERCLYINVDNIIFITRSNRKTTIHTVGDITFETYQPLQELEERLRNYRFFRCHKGFIINPDMVLEISPWGGKTFLVKFSNTNETALMTVEKAKEFHKRFCLE